MRVTGNTFSSTQPLLVGSYDVYCEQPHWPKRNLKIDIEETLTPGGFKASFYLGEADGLMIICASQSGLKEYCFRADRGKGNWYNYPDDEHDYGHDFSSPSPSGGENNVSIGENHQPGYKEKQKPNHPPRTKRETWKSYASSIQCCSDVARLGKT
jgi:hypothetical protein